VTAQPHFAFVHPAHQLNLTAIEIVHAFLHPMILPPTFDVRVPAPCTFGAIFLDLGQYSHLLVKVVFLAVLREVAVPSSSTDKHECHGGLNLLVLLVIGTP
jgi:hypothetical protein